MKHSLEVKFDSVVKADPARLKQRHPNSNYEFFYKLCISIPILISFSLVFFMIFYISPRGESMALFQKGIYTWNKDDMAKHMESLDFEYEIQPQARPFAGNDDSLRMVHMDKEVESQDQKSSSQAMFEENIRSIFFYKNSYFRATAAKGIFEPIKFNGFSPPDSDNYCMGTLWRSKDSLITSDFQEIEEQPFCSNGLDPRADFSSGLNFDLYKWEASSDFSCKLSTTCELSCNILNGSFDPESGQCFELRVLEKLCVKVGMSFVDDLQASQAEIVSNVKLVNGCYADGNVAMYVTQPLSQEPDGMTVITFDAIAVEVRSEEDPQTVFTAIDPKLSTDLSIFFWLSMVSLLMALVSILYLGFYYQCYIKDS